MTKFRRDLPDGCETISKELQNMESQKIWDLFCWLIENISTESKKTLYKAILQTLKTIPNELKEVSEAEKIIARTIKAMEKHTAVQKLLGEPFGSHLKDNPPQIRNKKQ
jgi:hypothetical protein